MSLSHTITIGVKTPKNSGCEARYPLLSAPGSTVVAYRCLSFTTDPLSRRLKRR
jgi:hypothetical protein